MMMKEKLLCRMNLHNYKVTRELRVRENGYIKTYFVSKCERCGKLKMALHDVLVDSITPGDIWGNQKETGNLIKHGYQFE